MPGQPGAFRASSGFFHTSFALCSVCLCGQISEVTTRIAEQIKNTKLTAPFAGTVTTLDIHTGEYVTPGTVILRLADTSAMQVETTDLTELNIVNVKEGTPVTMTFDAIPGLELPGKVGKIRSYGDNKQGDIVYTVYVTPDQQDARLRWNMTAKVNISTQ